MRASKAVHFPWLAMNAHSVVKRPGRGAAICMASSRAEGPLQDFTRSAQRVGTIAWSKYEIPRSPCTLAVASFSGLLFIAYNV